jgi:hypothetical protein
MAKKVLLLTFSLLLVLSVSAFAGEGSDTIGACKLLPQLRYGYTVTNWDTASSEAGPFRSWDAKAHNYYLQANWGLFSNLDVIALVGGRSVCSEADYYASRSIHYVTKTEAPMFMWGVGFKLTFFRANGFYVGGGALFTHAISGNYDYKTYRNGALWNDSPSIYTRNVYKLVPELHVGYHFKNIALTPYVGVDVVVARAHVEIEGDGDIDLYVDNPVFMFTGLDYYINDKLYVNVEGRGNFVDGWGVETGVGYLFDICGAPAPEPIPEPAPPVIEPKLEPMSKN